MIHATLAYAGSLLCFAVAGAIGYQSLSATEIQELEHNTVHEGLYERLDAIESELAELAELADQPTHVQYQHQTITPVTRIYHDTGPTTKTGPELEAAADRLIARHRR